MILWFTQAAAALNGALTQRSALLNGQSATAPREFSPSRPICRALSGSPAARPRLLVVQVVPRPVLAIAFGATIAACVGAASVQVAA